MNITLSREHGVNPGMLQCFFCMEASGVALYGRLPNDAEAPRMVCVDKVPCSKCADYMKQGIILVSVQDAAIEKLFHHWHCQYCGNHKEVECQEGVQAYPPLCGSRGCRFKHGDVTMQKKGIRPTDNPFRSGCWVVVAEQFITRVIHPPELVEHMLKVRFAFVPDAAWDRLGLPKGKINGSDQREQDEGVAE